MNTYISGKMTGCHEMNRPEFMKAQEELEKCGHTVFNPALLPDGKPYEWYMDRAFEMINECDAVYMIPGWESSFGAKAEHFYATKKGKQIWYNGFMVNEVE
jgi:hypothetical protein